jgi:hypothetical protein
MTVKYKIYTKELLVINNECFWTLRLLDISYYLIDEYNDYEFVAQLNDFNSEEEAVKKITELLQLNKEGKITLCLSNQCLVIQKEYYL